MFVRKMMKADYDNICKRAILRTGFPGGLEGPERLDSNSQVGSLLLTFIGETRLGRRMDGKGGIYIKYRIASNFVLMRASCFTVCSASRRHSLSPWTLGKTGSAVLVKSHLSFNWLWSGFAVFWSQCCGWSCNFGLHMFNTVRCEGRHESMND